MAAMAAGRRAAKKAARLGLEDAGPFNAWFSGVEAVLLDCDGVIWRGTRPIEGAADAVQRLRAAGKRVVFLTNNSTKSRESYVTKLHSICGIEAVPDDIISSAFAAARLLAMRELEPVEGHEKVGVYVVGEAGLHTELQEQGFRTLGLEEGRKPFDFAEFSVDRLDDGVRAVVQGFDTAFSYNKLAVAASYIRYKGAQYIATNTDETFPASGMLIPGGGSMVAALRVGSGTVPAVAGKPSSTLMELVSGHLGVAPERCAMIGDRLNTDIRFGNGGGAKTALVMTGVTSEADLAGAEGDDVPGIVLPSLAIISHYLDA